MRITRIVTAIVTLFTLLAFYSLYHNLTEKLEAQTFQATEEQMVETVHLLAAQLEMQIGEADDTLQFESLSQLFTQAKTHHFEAKIFNLQKTHIGTNFYLTDSKGIVLHDSARPERIGRDYSEKNDVYLALKNRYAVRSSRDDEYEPNSSILYIATAVKNPAGRTLGVLSIYKPQNDVRPFIEQRHRSILISLAVIGGSIIVFSLAVFTWLFQPLGKLTRFANAITRGERPDYPQLGKGREVNTLGKALREMRRALEGKNYVEQYVLILTHELKSPLAAISGASELLDEEMPVEQRKRFLENIRSESARSTKIIDGLLKLTQLESQTQLVKKQHIALEEVIHNACDALKPRLSTKDLTLSVHTQQEHRIIGDSMLLETALMNLLENAIQFSPAHSEICITTEKNGKHTTLSVADNGPGVPEYALDRVFERFYSHHPDHQERRKSSGIGLVFVQEVAKLHNGSATLENQVSGGAVAKLQFPAA